MNNTIKSMAYCKATNYQHASSDGRDKGSSPIRPYQSRKFRNYANQKTSNQVNENGYEYKKWGITGGCVYNWKDKKILIIDTSELNCRILSSLLRSTQANIELLFDPIKIRQFDHVIGKYDLIMMEVYLIGLNGMEVLKKIRLDDHNIPIIVQTVLVLPEHKRSVFDAGCDAFITKPLNLARLMEMMDELLK